MSHKKPKERIIPIIMEDDSEDNLESTDMSFSQNESVSSSTSTRETEDVVSNSEEERERDDVVVRSLPFADVREKIILVLDTSEDEGCSPFRVANNNHKPLEMLKRAIEIFLNNKQMISEDDEFALVILNEVSAVWTVNFTKNIKQVIAAIQKVTTCEAEDIFHLNSLFDVLLDKINVEELNPPDLQIPPPYIVRTILLYGRSYTIPMLEKTEEITALLNAPYFTLDVLMTHEPNGNNNHCENIFKCLQNLDTKGFAYNFSVERDAKTLLNSMGKLVSHPLQRPIQKLANYKITSFIEKK